MSMTIPYTVSGPGTLYAELDEEDADVRRQGLSSQCRSTPAPFREAPVQESRDWSPEGSVFSNDRDHDEKPRAVVDENVIYPYDEPQNAGSVSKPALDFSISSHDQSWKRNTQKDSTWARNINSNMNINTRFGSPMEAIPVLTAQNRKSTCPFLFDNKTVYDSPFLFDAQPRNIHPETPPNSNHGSSESFSECLEKEKYSNKQLAPFLKMLNFWINNKLQVLVAERTPRLVKLLAPVIADVILKDIAFREMINWRFRLQTHRTLNDAVAQIEKSCSEVHLRQALSSNRRYNDVLAWWIKDDLLPAINQDMVKFCHKYGFTSLRMSDMDITVGAPFGSDSPIQLHDVASLGLSIGNEVLNGCNGDALGALIATVSGIVTVIVVPIVVSLVLTIVMTIAAALSSTLAFIIASILALVPGPGWVILTALAGVSAFYLTMKGWESMKQEISVAMMDYELPDWVRTQVTEDDIAKALEKSKPQVVVKIERT